MFGKELSTLISQAEPQMLPPSADAAKYQFNPIWNGIIKTHSDWGGAESTPLITPLPFIRSKPNFV